MNKSFKMGFLLVALVAAGIGGFWAGRQDFLPFASSMSKEMGSAPSGPVAFYRDPDGPFYAAEPKQNAKGRAYIAVLQSEDVSFEPMPEKKEGEGKTGAGKIRFYRNPMGLPDTSPVPKKDSMGMDYIPVFDGDEEESGIVKLSPGKVQRTGVRSEPATQRRIAAAIRAPGIVALDERRVSVLSARVDTFVEKVETVTTGEVVTRNQPLVTLFSTEIAAAAAQFITELNTDGRAGATGGARKRLENLGVPVEAVAEIERNRKVPSAIVWRAPRDGLVLERNVVEGMKMAAGATLFRIADATKLWVLADVPEQEPAGLRLGTTATIRMRHGPEQVFAGRVSLVYPQVNMETRTTKVRIEVDNPDLALLPNMYAEVEIDIGAETPELAIPENAVIDNGERKIVLIDRGEGRFEPREVKTGRRGGGFIAILKGMSEGDKVVTSANFLIDAESNLKAALEAFVPADKETRPEKQP